MPTNEELLDLLRRLKTHSCELFAQLAEEHGENDLRAQLVLKEYCTYSSVIQLITNPEYFQSTAEIFKDTPPYPFWEELRRTDDQA